MNTNPALDVSSKHLLSSPQEPLSSLPSCEHTEHEPFNFSHRCSSTPLPSGSSENEPCFCEHALHRQRSCIWKGCSYKMNSTKSCHSKEEKQDHCFLQEHWFKKRWQTAPKMRQNHQEKTFLLRVPSDNAELTQSDSDYLLPNISTSDPILQHQDNAICHFPSVQPKKTTQGTELPKNWLEKTDFGWVPLTGRDTTPRGTVGTELWKNSTQITKLKNTNRDMSAASKFIYW